MKDIYDGLYCYDLDCELIDKNSGKTLKEFNAREFNRYDLSVGMVSGGIASYSQGYEIATMELDDINIEPRNHKIRIDSQIFNIGSIGTHSTALPYSNRKSRKEKVVQLS